MSRDEQVSLLVVDDHPIVVVGVTVSVRSDPRITVLGGAESGREAERLAARKHPDVILLDVRLPDMLASEAVHRVLAVNPDCRIILFTAFPDHPAVRIALDKGAAGCLIKDVATDELVTAIHSVMRGERVLDRRLAASTYAPITQHARDRLGITNREYEVLRHVALGKTNPEIGADLGLTRTTVKTYLQSAMQKLGAHNRVDAIIKASEARLL